ncbi:hypothetical protein KSS94_09305 [Pseudomonas fakonensis]|uniref:Uncharacterized protein n=1 Tax=Pseudomonas fakonensis TaxID=2842355 RepID=A0ABX8NBP2_9PSED|nr:hypothetical protein [Pseudomonas fakonensis]QXH53290.1 hypothetical protein KSS94_09305 [Pseudomonas fakonensis]
MSVLKLAKGLWEELESNQKSGDAVQEEMLRRADEILKSGYVTYPSLTSVVRNAIDKVKAGEKIKHSA